MANLITTSEVIAVWAGFDSLSSLAQARLIEAASTAIERYCRRTFASDEVTEYLDGNGTSRIWLDRRPVTEVTSVTVNDVALDNSTNAAWVLEPNTGTLTRGTGQHDSQLAINWPRGTRNVVVVYTGGYSAIPSDVKMAAATLAKHIHDAATKTGILSSENIGAYSYVLNTAFSKGGFPPAVAMLLASYVSDPIL
jgi:hypothetical protein